MYRLSFPLVIVFFLSFLPTTYAADAVNFISYKEASERLGLSSYVFKPGVEYKNTVKLTGPAVLDKSNTRYTLENDVHAPNTAFTIAAADIVLDLGGHLVEYGTQADSSCYGITNKGFHRNNLIIGNGTIRQSPHMDEKNPALKMSSPIFFHTGVGRVELSGLTIEYQSAQTSGIFAPWTSGEIHHNVVRDKGHIVENRHRGAAAINAGRGHDMKVYSNFVERTRQGGIMPGLRQTVCLGNIVNIDSVVSNSSGIGYYGQGAMEDHSWVCEKNIVRGKGSHPVGIGVVSDVGNGIVRDNDVEVMVTEWNDEYNQPIGGTCFRSTWGADNILIEGNRFVCHAAPKAIRGKDSWGRTLWVAIKKDQTMTFRNNTIIGVAEGGSAKIPAVGVSGFNKSSELVFEGNKIASSWANVMLGDYYGDAAGYPQFINNEFTRLKDYKDYYTIRSDAPYKVSTGVFVDNIAKDGASLDNMNLELDGKALKDALFMRTCRILVKSGDAPVAKAAIVLKDKTGATVAEGLSDESGRFNVRLLERRVTNGKGAPDAVSGKSIDESAPYSVTVESPQGAGKATVTKDSDLAVIVDLGS